MTVCVAALAEDGKAIILVADKALTYGDNVYRPAMQGESGGIRKILPIGVSKWQALLAGNPTMAEDVVRTAIEKSASKPDICKTVGSMMNCLREAYQEVRQRAVIDGVLKPRLLTLESFINRSRDVVPLQDGYFLDVAKRVVEFALGSSLLVCGFDSGEPGTSSLSTTPGRRRVTTSPASTRSGLGQKPPFRGYYGTAPSPEMILISRCTKHLRRRGMLKSYKVSASSRMFGS